jgi:glucose/arabinose dehydrogenase
MVAAMSRRFQSIVHVGVGTLLLAGVAIGAQADSPSAAALGPPVGFQEEIVFSGLTQPTAVRFAADGRVFVAEKNGIVKVFDNLSDSTPTVFADLRTQVHNFWDRGLLGLALDPAFPANPWVYVLYTHDAAIGGTAPRWGRWERPSTAARHRRGLPPTAAWSAAGCPGCRPPVTRWSARSRC